MKKTFYLVITILISSFATKAQTVGLLENTGEVEEGYFLFNGGPGGGFGGGSLGSYLVNTCGELINSWLSQNNAGLSCYLDFEGNLLRPVQFGGGNQLNVGGGGGGGIEKHNWEGDLIWTFDANEPDFFQHHDVEPLPNGNLLFISWEARTVAEAAALGRTGGAMLVPTRITEVEPTYPTGGNVVWEWHVFDHTVQDINNALPNFGVMSENPQLVDINFGGGGDWLHCNGIDYIAEYDLIVVSSLNLDEIFVIDHSTTTAEAASHNGGTYGKGGDLLYRWGNPQNYLGNTFAGDQQINGQHGVRWLANENGVGGKFGIFNNNGGGGGPGGGGTSFVIAIEAPMNADGSFIYNAGTAFGPATKLIDEAVAGAPTGSNVQPQPNGNYFYCINSGGSIGEMNANGAIVWEYQIPVDGNGPIAQGNNGNGSSSFNSEKYFADYAGFIGKDLTPQAPIEGTNPLTDNCVFTDTSVVVIVEPVANYTFVLIDESTINLTNNSSDGNDTGATYFWDFGNGDSSTEESPSYTFTTSGTYNVCLTITNSIGDNELCQDVEVVINSIINYTNLGFEINPNPAKDQFSIISNQVIYTLSIYNINGKIIEEHKNANTINISDFAEGIYLIKIKTDKGIQTEKLIIER